MTSPASNPYAGLIELLAKRKDQEFDGECVLTSREADDIIVALSRLTRDVEELEEIVVALADGADKCSVAPHYIVHPFFAIYRKHGETIARARDATLTRLSRPTELEGK